MIHGWFPPAFAFAMSRSPTADGRFLTTEDTESTEEIVVSFPEISVTSCAVVSFVASCLR